MSVELKDLIEYVKAELTPEATSDALFYIDEINLSLSATIEKKSGGKISVTILSLEGEGSKESAESNPIRSA